MKLHAMVLTLALAPALVAGGMAQASAAVSGGARAYAAPKVLYVAPHGHGKNCLRSAPCDLVAAKARVEQLNQDMRADIDVDLAGGTYRLSAGMTLGPADSGSSGYDVVWQAEPGEVPVFNGAVRVTGFTEYDKQLGIWRARVPASAVVAGGEQLFVAGRRAQLARSTALLPGLKVTATGFSTTDPAYASFRNQRRIQLVDQSDWKHIGCPVASITAAPGGGSDFHVLPSCWQANHVHVPNLGFPFNGSGLPGMSSITYVENAYELLKQPGQFYLDKQTHYLYYIPRPGQDMTTADVELPVSQDLLSLRGTPGHLAPINQDTKGATYSGAGWQHSTERNLGDFDNDVELTTRNGNSMSFAFAGAGLEVLGETAANGAGFDVYVDGKRDTTHRFTEHAKGHDHLAQQVVFSVHGLAQGRHVVKLVKSGGAELTVDGFEVIPTMVDPVRNITFRGIDFEYTTWNLPETTGYIDNQAGVLWDASGPLPTPSLVPAAVTVSRGRGITFAHDRFMHLGANAVYLANGTQYSTVTGGTITDAAGGGVYVGNVDDYFQNDTALMTLGDRVADNLITYIGQDYSDTVGIWAGYTRDLVIAHNDIGHTPYSGMSIGWGWGYASSCKLQAAEKLKTCAHGTDYAGGNAVVDNYVHDVMKVLHDGGPIYTNGGQGENGAGIESVLSGNYVAVGNHTNNMLYHDEGSSYWRTFDNVVAHAAKAHWMGMWTPTINHITIGPRNYSSTPSLQNHGSDIDYTPPVLVTDGNWPAPATAIMAAAGLEPKPGVQGVK